MLMQCSVRVLFCSCVGHSAGQGNGGAGLRARQLAGDTGGTRPVLCGALRHAASVAVPFQLLYAALPAIFVRTDVLRAWKWPRRL